jgi:hypothetical protein
MSMKYYGVIGKTVSVCAQRFPQPHYIEMIGPNIHNGIARPDGSWSVPPKDKDTLIEEYVSKYYSINERLRIITKGTEEEKQKLDEVLDKANKLYSKR